MADEPAVMAALAQGVLRLLGEMRARYAARQPNGSSSCRSRPEQVYQLMGPELDLLMQEQVWVLLLSAVAGQRLLAGGVREGAAGQSDTRRVLGWPGFAGSSSRRGREHDGCLLVLSGMWAAAVADGRRGLSGAASFAAVLRQEGQATLPQLRVGVAKAWSQEGASFEEAS